MIRKVFIYFAFLGIAFCTSTCSKECIETKSITLSNPVEFSFLIAGHTYGSPNNWVEGLYPDFLQKFSFINSYPNIEFGVFTGDIIPKDEDYRWDFALRDIGMLNFPVYLAPGNHDLGFNIFYNRFGYFYKSFFQNEDLFILLTPGLHKWNIDGDQLSFLKNTLKYDGPKARNIFIFHHELIWWSPEGIFGGIELNYTPYYPGKTNFWEEVIPLFETLNKPSYFFAGDLGGSKQASPFMYYETNNIHLIASGMGAGIDDNFIIADVHENGLVSFNLCAIQGVINRLGYLEDFILP